MKVLFSGPQAEFIKKEFGYKFKADVEINIPKEVIKEIHNKAFDIEADELPENQNDEWSERCKLAVSICNV